MNYNRLKEEFSFLNEEIQSNKTKQQISDDFETIIQNTILQINYILNEYKKYKNNVNPQ